MRRAPFARAAALPAALAAGALACGPADDSAPAALHVTGPCEVPTVRVELPPDVRETSGVAASRRRPGVFWTHNDSGGDSAIFAIDSAATLLARVRVRGATNRDWEDIAIAPCEPGADEDCVFLGDTGDNRERRERVVIFRIPEPQPGDSVSRRALRLDAVFPGGPRDAEGLFVDDAGIHIVTKGRSQAVELYRLAPPYRAGRTRTLSLLQELAPPPTSISAQVTAAAVSPDGRTVALRTYSGLRFFGPAGDSLARLGPPADLFDPGQPQGEGVDFLPDGRLVLTGEAGGRFEATLSILTCDPRAPSPPSPAPADTTGP